MNVFIWFNFIHKCMEIYMICNNTDSPAIHEQVVVQIIISFENCCLNQDKSHYLSDSWVQISLIYYANKPIGGSMNSKLVELVS